MTPRPDPWEAAKLLSQSLTPDQIDCLLELCDECQALGATPDQLSPIYCAALSDFSPLTPEEEAHVLALAKTHNWDVF